jgi:signal transduction histidine kinase
MNKLLKRFSDYELAAIKLSVFYVLIAMVISISFSIALYNISTKELGRGLGRTFRVINQCSPEKLPPGFENLEHARVEQINEINGNVADRLVYFNLIILVVSSALSYFLAKKTLHPLEQAMESQQRFTADASHELRTPLSAMRAEIEVALRDQKLTKDEARKLLESNIEEIAKLESLSNALLKLARYENVKIELKETNISDVIIEAYERAKSLADKKNIKFATELKEFKIMGDKGSLVELFIILIDNAIKYSDKNSKIEIKTFGQGRKIIVTVKDYGYGIKSADLPYVFDRFFRADNSRAKNKVSGYGLGLSLAKQIADLNEAQIEVESAVGKGTEFMVSFLQIKS